MCAKSISIDGNLKHSHWGKQMEAKKEEATKILMQKR
jgi:hypothetical protein